MVDFCLEKQKGFFLRKLMAGMRIMCRCGEEYVNVRSKERVFRGAFWIEKSNDDLECEMNDAIDDSFK